jgi:hypothetical protein
VLEGRLKPTDELTIGNVRYQVQWDNGNEPVNLKSRHEPVRAGRHAGAEDDLLESCDEPVPLNDSDDEDAAPLKAAPAARDRPRGDDSFVIPEKLELAPPSDILPPQQHD